MHLSELVAALRAPGTPDELAHAESTVAAMAAAHREAAAGVVPLAPVDRRPALVAAGATVGIVGALLFAGTAAAAFSGALPAGLQDAAHRIFGAPSYTPPPSGTEEIESGSESASGDPVGPAASTDAASLYGLCTAFAGVASDDPQAGSVAYRALASAAAAAAETVEEYCGEVLAAGGKPTTPPSKNPTAVPSKKPTAAPSKKPTAAPSKKPTEAPSRKPTAAPSKKPSDKPTTAGKPSGAGR
jgi:hypothetical protein